MSGAVVYLASRSAWNRLARQLKRLRTPRYLIAMLLGLLYLYVITQQQASRADDPTSSGWAEIIAPLVVAIAAAWAWIFGAERRVLAFTPADVTFLFPGPVTRRGLVSYKLVRAQMAVLFNVMLWTLLLSLEPFGVSVWLRAVSLWVLLTTLSLHRLGASFVRSGLLEYGGTGLRRGGLSLLVAGSCIAMLVWGLWSVAGQLATALPSADADALIAALTMSVRQPPLEYLVVPFRLVTRPLTAHTPGAWVDAIGPAVGILVLHFIWVIRSDATFEESAVEYTLARARRETPEQRRRATLASMERRRLPRVLRLESSGWPAGAIFWKNIVAVLRAQPVGGFVITGIAASASLALLSFGSGAPGAEILGSLVVVAGILMFFLGPQWIRNDLRGDLHNLDLLRSYPVSGRSVIAAETAGSALVLTVIQIGLFTVAYLAFLGNRNMTLTLEERSFLLMAAIVYLPFVNYLAMLIQNGGAILFPSWVRSGPERAGGVEALGQNMLLIAGHAVVLTMLVAAPALVAGVLYVILRPAIGDWAQIPGTGAALWVVVFESRVIVNWLGRVLERTEPSAVGAG